MTRVEYLRRWRKCNPEKMAEYRRRWHKRNPEKVSKYRSRWRARKLERIYKILGRRQCAVCGTRGKRGYWDRLEYHHRDPRTKLFAISDAITRETHTMAEIKREAKKCVVLCRTCHAKHHHIHRRRAA